MAYTLTNGVGIDIASAYASSVNMTAISNASAAVATLAAGHGVVVGDILEISSGWARLNGRLARVAAVSTNDVTLENINTTSTTLFPAGQGAGTVRRITAWTEISQILEASFSGGEQQYADITSIADVVQKQMPTVRNAVSMSLTVGDDPTLAWYGVVRAAALTNAITGLRVRFPNGSRLLGNGYWSFLETPTMAKNEPLKVKIDFSAVAELTRAS